MLEGGTCTHCRGPVYWLHFRPSGLPAGIAWSNGRVEAEEIDVDTKFAGRVLQLLVDDGDMVAPGQIVARMDTRDLQAEQQKTQVKLAQQEFDRTSALLQRGFATNELLDQRQQALSASIAALAAANDRVDEAERALRPPAALSLQSIAFAGDNVIARAA